MKIISALVSLFLFTCCVSCIVMAQGTMKTVVTQGPVVEGESFRVQYVLDDFSREDDFFTPRFNGFRVVNGPQIFEGATYGPDGPHKLKNVVYTLAAIKAGHYVIPGGSAKVNGTMVKSNAAPLEVIGVQKAIALGLVAAQSRPNPDYYLKPGEDPYKKIGQNLFLRVTVDRQTCYVGEPVVATFKLYSRLESRSDIVKNPGLYGFTVQDIVGLHERKSSPEMVNGRNFDVHTIRKVQMYPLRPGVFTVDPMQIRNRVEFNTRGAAKEPGQEIVEGVVDDDDYSAMADTKVFETDMATDPLSITVKALPDAGRPSNYNGATGAFRMDTYLEKTSIHAGEEGVFVVQIIGTGNFTQLVAPQVNWPAGVEGFDPEVKDEIDLTSSPMKGQRYFRFHFVPSKEGRYTLPSIAFSFFRPDSNQYKEVHTKAVALEVTAASTERKGLLKLLKKDDGGLAWWVIALAALLVIVGALLISLKFRRKEDGSGQPVVKAPAHIPVTELLQKSAALSLTNDPAFYIELRNAIWLFFSSRLGISGSGLNRSGLRKLLEEKAIPVDDRLELSAILDHCETGMFTNLSEGDEKGRWLVRAEQNLERIGGLL